MIPSIARQPEPLLAFRQVGFGYGDKRICEDLSLSFPGGGAMIGLVGPNGAGKTTLLRLIMGMMEPDRGEILLEGQPVARMARRELARRMSLVPQDTHVDHPFTVEEMLAMGRHPHLGRFQPLRRQDVALLERAMAQTDIAHLRRREVNLLSGGERQRVLVARSIVQETPVVLLDEVTANLDLSHQLEVMDLARSLANEGRLVVATIHDLSIASRYCDRLLLLSDGQLQADGAPADVLTHANLRRFFHIEAAIAPSDHFAGAIEITALRSAKPADADDNIPQQQRERAHG